MSTDGSEQVCSGPHGRRASALYPHGAGAAQHCHETGADLLPVDSGGARARRSPSATVRRSHSGDTARVVILVRTRTATRRRQRGPRCTPSPRPTRPAPARPLTAAAPAAARHPRVRAGRDASPAPRASRWSPPGLAACGSGDEDAAGGATAGATGASQVVAKADVPVGGGVILDGIKVVVTQPGRRATSRRSPPSARTGSARSPASRTTSSSVAATSASSTRRPVRCARVRHRGAAGQDRHGRRGRAHRHLTDPGS